MTFTALAEQAAIVARVEGLPSHRSLLAMEITHTPNQLRQISHRDLFAQSRQSA